MNEFDFLSMVYYNEVVAKQEKIDEYRRLAKRHGIEWVVQNYPELNASEIEEIVRGIY